MKCGVEARTGKVCTHLRMLNSVFHICTAKIVNDMSPRNASEGPGSLTHVVSLMRYTGAEKSNSSRPRLLSSGPELAYRLLAVLYPQMINASSSSAAPRRQPSLPIKSHLILLFCPSLIMSHRLQCTTSHTAALHTKIQA